MSKHSKNNSSSSVFTYAERQKLKGLYGTIETRIGQDSVKKFEDCTICNNKFIEPCCCDHGHMFCRSCAIEYLIKQKRNQQQSQLEVQKFKLNQQIKNKQKQLQNEVKRIDNFQKHDNFLAVTDRNDLFKQQLQKKSKADEPVFQSNSIKMNSVKPTGIYQLTENKDKYVKSSFWVRQNTPQINQKPQGMKDGEANIIHCPGQGVKHKLTLKKLRQLKINELDSVHCCWICRKQIGRQKIGAYKCGHVVCIGCKSTKCEVCDDEMKWIQIEGNASAFSAHNKSQVKTYTHAFLT